MAKRLPTRTEIIDVLNDEDRPLHARELATRLRIAEGDYPALQRILDDLALQGVLAARPGQRFKVAGPTTGAGSAGATREGVLTINPRGFGFVSSIGDAGDDVFIGADEIGGAMHGDKVLVRIRARGTRGPEGEILRILSRGTTRVAGLLRRRGKSAWVEPDDTRVRGPIVLASEVDNRGSEGNSGTDGDAVIVTITRHPERPGENPEGKLEAVLGRPGELRVEAAKILVIERVEEVHSEDAVKEAEGFGAEVPEPMKEGREDLRHLPLPTIDPEDARDHDDAVWVERTPEGGYKVWIAIADVSSYVTPGTKLDEEAMARGCSIYLPDRAIPMLPRALSSNLCSLLPGTERLCLCAEVELDAGGTVLNERLIRGVMKSQAKLHYGGVARALGFTELPERQPEADAMKDGLRVAYDLSRLLRGKRMKRGALDFDLPEAKVVLDPQSGEPTDVQRRSQDPGVKRAYQLIEELMLLANEVVARWLEAKKLPTIFRVHAPPDETKLERFASMCETLGIPFDVESTRDPKLLSALLKSFAEHPLANVLNSLLLRSMKQAVYDVANVGHFGLASKAYLHFTSPIRRYPDIVAHRVVHKVLLGESIEKDHTAVEKLAGAALASSVAERRAMEIERSIVDLYRAFLMKDRIGDTFEGTVSAVVGSGVFVVLDAPFVDVLVKLEDLGAERYEIDEEGLRVVAPRSGDTVELGDRLEIEIIDAAILRRSVYGRRLRPDSVERASGEARPDRSKKLAARGAAKESPKGAPRRGKAPPRTNKAKAKSGQRTAKVAHSSKNASKATPKVKKGFKKKKR